MGVVGRINRLVFRAASANPDVTVGAISDPFMDLDYTLYQLKYDSMRKQFLGIVATEKEDGKEFLVTNGKDVRASHEKDPGSIGWGGTWYKIVCESACVFILKEKVELHLEGGCAKVNISAPPKDAVPVCVMGVNHIDYKTSGIVVSNASYTTNCHAPTARVINGKFGIVGGLINSACNDNDGRCGKRWR